MNETQTRFFNELAETIAFNAKLGNLETVKALLAHGLALSKFATLAKAGK